ncbi:hypothetical protein D3C72_1334740 [compost metagenome]
MGRVGHQHDRRGSGRQQSLCVRQINATGAARQPVDIRQHHRQRFAGTPFAKPQALYGLRLGSIASQVKTAQPFDGHNLPGS